MIARQIAVVADMHIVAPDDEDKTREEINRPAYQQCWKALIIAVFDISRMWAFGRRMRL
jgi:DNA invertase Pin-like site-specific DNA recombinase